MASQVKELTGCDIAPTRPLLNINGVPMGRTWGGAAHILQLGKHLEDSPEKALRFLHMIEEISKDVEAYLNVSTGREGLDWEIGPEGYRVIGQALEDPNYCRINMMNESAPLTNNFFFPSLLDVRSEELTPDVKRTFDESYCKAEWSMRNPIGKSDVVPSASEYLEDLRRFQTIAFVDFITGAKPLDDFDDFVVEWKQRGGEIMLREGKEVYEELQTIYQRVGAK
jgi:putative aldouronate transport system substrate-binding protein